jgi:peptidoglycan/xylan/chitin deacetylase (PgdA/CDA1 family)
MKRTIFKIIRFSGLPFLFREIIQRKKITILLFHDISREKAKKTFLCLRGKYHIIGLNDFLHAVENRTILPDKSLIITFDDGHIGNFDLFPVIKELKIPVTIFLCASIMGTNRHFWWKGLNGNLYFNSLIRLQNTERLTVLSGTGFEQDKEFDKPHALQKAQIEMMKTHVNFQSHTMFHPVLPNCDLPVARNEIFYSKKILENEFNLKINALSYPNGDYSEREIHLAKEAGYKCGITVDYGFNTLKTDIFRLKRLSVNDVNDLNELIVKASGVWGFFKTINGHRQEYGHRMRIEE